MEFYTGGLARLDGDVIVVEDDALLGELLCEIVREMGGNAIGFTSADDALMHMLKAPAPPYLVITDHLLPGQLTGVELAGMVTQRWPHLPVVVTTGYSFGAHDVLPAGVRFLAKPWSLEQLVETVTALMPEHASAS